MSPAPTSPPARPAAAADPWTLGCRGRVLDCRPGRVHVMGILNVTPDSFSDGGCYAGLDAAVARAQAMAAEGAALIDVGGESTRPAGQAYGRGATPVSLDEELARVVPVIEAIAREVPGVLISVDTYKGAVAREALRAGAHLVNDVSGLRQGLGTARAAAAYGAPLIVMHARGPVGGGAAEKGLSPVPPAGLREGDEASVEAEVIASLRRSVRAAEAEGVEGVVVDAGFGFGKTAEENLCLVASTDRLRASLGRPVLVGVSRKRTVGEALGSPERPAPLEARLYGSLGLAALAALRGASIVRVHDVRPTAEALRVLLAAEAARGAFGDDTPGEGLSLP